MSKKQSKTDNSPRQLTVDEAKERLICHFWHLVNYWETVKNPVGINERSSSPEIVQRHRLEGLLHSILAALDGSTITIPAMEIRPIVPPEDIEFFKNEPADSNFPVPRQWFPPDTDIGGYLHELMYSIGRKHGLCK